MGNTVSAAQSTAASLTSLALGGSGGSSEGSSPLHASDLPPNHINIEDTHSIASPPPECPMHKKDAKIPKECPVSHDMSLSDAPPTHHQTTPAAKDYPSECPMHQGNQKQTTQVYSTL